MKIKISSKLVTPMFSGILAGMILGGIAAYVVFHNMFSLPGWSAVVFELPLLLALRKSMHRGAWVYSNARKLHSAEYYYNLGNGVEFKKAVNHYENKVTNAVLLWMRRDLLSRQWIAWLTACILLMVAEMAFFRPVFLVACTIILFCLSIYVALKTMLFTARKLSYDNFGNQRG